MAGFSLVEFLLVAFLMAIGLLGLAALITMTMRSETAGRQREVAAVLAGNVLEFLVADARQSSMRRMNGVAVPTGLLVANATDDTVYTFSMKDEAGTARSTFDLLGRPNATSPVFQAEWVRRAPATSATATAAQTAGSEVVVNVRWSEQASGGATTTKWVSVSRYITY